MAAKTEAEKIREKIVHPILRDAFDADWYWPFELTNEHKKLAGVKRAIKEGWSEWIETEEDVEAIRNGYVFDLSKDHNGKVVYWYKGRWVRYGKNKRLIEVDESEIGHCGGGDHACRFAELFLFHTKDPLKGRPYRFIPWQRKIAMLIFGWIRYFKDDNTGNIRQRRFSMAMLELSKKNGKSDLASVFAVILLRADYASKAFIYGAAADRNQGALIYNEARDYVKQSDYLEAEIGIIDSKKTMVHYESGSSYQVVSADAYRSEGIDASAVLLDELHEQPNRKLVDTLKKAGLARAGRFIFFVTTTYGASLSANTGKYTSGNIWAEEHLKTKAQMEGKRSNYRRLNMVASAEPIPVVVTHDAEVGATRLKVFRLQQPIAVGEVIEIEFSEAVGGLKSTWVKLTQPAKRYQWHIDVDPIESDIPSMSEGTANENPLVDGRLEHAIQRANPSLGVTILMESIKEIIDDAVGPQAIADAIRKCLNIVAGGGRTWLSGASWMACGRKRVLPSSIMGQRCMGGFDASLTNDLTSFWLAFPNWKAGMRFGRVQTPLIRLAGLVWVPDEDIERREQIEEVPYRAYAEMKYIGKFGYVRLCSGSAIDYKQVGEDIIEFTDMFKCQAVAYDPNYASLVVGSYLQPSGLKCIPHRQGGVSMGPPTKRFENLVKRGHILHGNHPLLNLAVEGAVLDTPDKVGNTFPSKGKSTSRIDPLMSTLMACGWCCDPPQEARSSGAYSGEVGSGIFG
jgi:phage terminase large subunit-like protein